MKTEILLENWFKRMVIQKGTVPFGHFGLSVIARSVLLSNLPYKNDVAISKEIKKSKKSDKKL